MASKASVQACAREQMTTMHARVDKRKRSQESVAISPKYPSECIRADDATLFACAPPHSGSSQVPVSPTVFTVGRVRSPCRSDARISIEGHSPGGERTIFRWVLWFSGDSRGEPKPCSCDEVCAPAGHCEAQLAMRPCDFCGGNLATFFLESFVPQILPPGAKRSLSCGQGPCEPTKILDHRCRRRGR